MIFMVKLVLPPKWLGKESTMRRGCISLGEVQCDDCHRTVPYPERYLIVEDTEGTVSRLCASCCLNKGYASYKQEKAERVITFLE